jgi:hypothetical protein
MKLFVVVISLAVVVIVVVIDFVVGDVVVDFNFVGNVDVVVDFNFVVVFDVVGVVVIDFDVVVNDFVDFSSFQRFRFSLELNVSSRFSMFGENFDVGFVFLEVHCGLMPF